MLVTNFNTKANIVPPLKLIRVLLLAPFIFLVGCSYYPVQDGLSHPQPIGEFKKCADVRNHQLPTCFCHKQAILRSPDRAGYCAAIKGEEHYTHVDHSANVDYSVITENVLELELPAVENVEGKSDWLVSNLGKEFQPRSKEWLKAFRKLTLSLENPIKESTEEWSDNTSLYLSGMPVYDDCDTSESLLDLAFALGGFEMGELAKILVDSNPYDSLKADHYVSAVWLDGRWMVLDQQDEKLKPLIHIELGGYMTRDGKLASKGEIIAYRKLNQTGWYQGVPPKVNLKS